MLLSCCIVRVMYVVFFFFFQAEDGIRDVAVTGVQTCALPILGFLPETMNRYKALLHLPYGIILVGGPTGSGKTTTLYTSINEIDRNKHNIMTIEDPVEYQFTDISQSQLDPKSGITFADGLRARLRQGPGVILVGEIRDKETAITAGQAALTRHPF